MTMSPLVMIVLLFYLMLLASAIVIWFAFAPARDRRPGGANEKRTRERSTTTRSSARTPSATESPAPTAARVGRGAVRPPSLPPPPAGSAGAATVGRNTRTADARATTKQEADPFERFIRSKNDDVSL
jgi:cytoskeletal protein RodZ